MTTTWRPLLLICWLMLGLMISQPAPTAALGEYIFASGDKLQVFVWQHPELCATVEVRSDGRISTPLVKDMMASGKTVPQLERDMEKALSGNVHAPKVRIVVAGPPGTVSVPQSKF